MFPLNRPADCETTSEVLHAVFVSLNRNKWMLEAVQGRFTGLLSKNQSAGGNKVMLRSPFQLKPFS